MSGKSQYFDSKADEEKVGAFVGLVVGGMVTYGLLKLGASDWHTVFRFAAVIVGATVGASLGAELSRAVVGILMFVAMLVGGVVTYNLLLKWGAGDWHMLFLFAAVIVGAMGAVAVCAALSYLLLSIGWVASMLSFFSFGRSSTAVSRRDEDDEEAGQAQRKREDEEAAAAGWEAQHANQAAQWEEQRWNRDR